MGPEFLDRDYGNNPEADEYIEEEPMITEQPNTYSNVNIKMDQDYYDNEDTTRTQEHVQDDYDDEDQAGNYMNDDEYDDIETTTIGHSFVNQRHDTESSDDPPHDPEFLDRDYGNNPEADKYIEEEPMITEQPNTYSNVNIKMDQDYYDNEGTTRTQEHVQDDYDDEDQAGNYMDDDE